MYFDFSFFHMMLILWQFLFWQDVFCEFFMWENEKFYKINYFSWFWIILIDYKMLRLLVYLSTMIDAKN